MIRIALATCAEHPHLDDDSRLLVAPLQARGIEVETPRWDDPSVAWDRYCFCLIRSTWDYQHRHAQYVAWACHVDRVSRLYNSAAVVAWNTDKRYLDDLARRGIRTIPTCWLPRGPEPDPAQARRALHAADLVVKPAVSATGYETFRLREGDAAGEERLRRLAAERDVMLQPYVESITTTGELSLLFVDGRLLHAVRKTPRAGEFRVHEEWGGTFVAITPDESDVAFAREVLQAIPHEIMYARVDLVHDADGHPCVSELELTEPSYYLLQSPASVDAVVEAIIDRT